MPSSSHLTAECAASAPLTSPGGLFDTIFSFQTGQTLPQSLKRILCLLSELRVVKRGEVLPLVGWFEQHLKRRRARRSAAFPSAQRHKFRGWTA